MPKITNNKNKCFKNWSTKKLKEEAIIYDEMIHNLRCCGTKDVSNLMEICLELENKGIEVHTMLEFK